jgi:hypothetical protein
MAFIVAWLHECSCKAKFITGKAHRAQKCKSHFLKMKKIGELTQRHQWVKRQRDEGKRTFRAIGKELGIGAQRVAQIYWEALSELKAEQNNPYCGLSTRAANILFYNEIRTPQGVRELWDGKKLQVRIGRGLGVATRNEILRWAGIEEPVEAEVKRCPLCGRKLASNLRSSSF